MNKDMQKTVCHTPTPGKQPTAIPTWKYELLRDVILKLLPTSEPGLASRDLPGLIKQALTPQELQRLGSVTWHTTSVRLNMEVKGEIRRVAKSRPMHLVRC